MFTGIIEKLGTVQAMKLSPSGAVLELSLEGWPDLSLGESVCVNGVCLTLAWMKEGILGFDLSPETLQRTTLGDLKTGSPVNLERALGPGSRLGGHFVSGHVDGVGRVAAIEPKGEGCEMVFSVPADLMVFIAEKGSVCVEGVSLTCFGLAGDTFRAALIPHTLKLTNLGKKKAGDAVNLEADLLMRYVQRLLQAGRGLPAPELFEKKHLDWDSLIQLASGPQGT